MNLTKKYFQDGMAKALALWKAGQTWECISHHERYDVSPFGRGMYAAVEAMSGERDCATREAFLHGFTRDEADRLVRDFVRKVD